MTNRRSFAAIFQIGSLCFYSALAVSASPTGAAQTSQLARGGEAQWGAVWRTTLTARVSAEATSLVSFASGESGPGGVIAIPQRDDSQLLIIDSLGQRVRAIGRAGQGPGELSRPAGFGWLGDTLWVGDGSSSSVSYFLGSGRFIRRAMLGPSSLPPGPGRPEVRGIGRPTIAYANSGGFAVLLSSEATPGRDLCTCFLWVDATGRGLGFIGTVPQSPDGTVRVPGIGGFSVPFSWASRNDISPTAPGLVSVFATADDRRRNQFRVAFVRVGADTIFNRAYTFSPDPIPSSKAQDAIRERAELGASGSAVAELSRRVPSSYAPFEWVFFDKSGRIWVQLRATPAGNRWLVLDATGNPLATVTLPRNVVAFEARGQRLWAYEEDQDGQRDLLILRISQ